MLDQVITYLIVLGAALFVIWKLFLPLRYKTMISYGLSGKTARYDPEPQTGVCGSGCPGCALATPRSKAVPGTPTSGQLGSGARGNG